MIRINKKAKARMVINSEWKCEVLGYLEDGTPMMGWSSGTRFTKYWVKCMKRTLFQERKFKHKYKRRLQYEKSTN